MVYPLLSLRFIHVDRMRMMSVRCMIFLDNVPLYAGRFCKQPCVWTKIR